MGKSDIVEQVAKKLKHKLCIFHPVVSDPTDFKGLPALVSGRADFLPYGDLRALLEAKEPTIAFLDDLGQAPAAVQAAVMQLILARSINGKAISKHVVFVAATNRREDRAGVTNILEPVKSRFVTIVQLDPDPEEWATWALDNDLPIGIVAFVRFKPDYLLEANTTHDIVNFSCPRTLANAGKLLDLDLDSQEILAGAVGEACATELRAFLQVFDQLPSIDTIILSPHKSPIPTDIAALYAISLALVQRITKENAGRVLIYANRLTPEFSTLIVKHAIRLRPEVQRTKAFIKWGIDHQDTLL